MFGAFPYKLLNAADVISVEETTWKKQPKLCAVSTSARAACGLNSGSGRVS